MAVDLLMGLSVGRCGAVTSSGDVVVGIILTHAHGRLRVARGGVANGRETRRRAVRGHRLALRGAVVTLVVSAAVLGASGSLFLARLALGLFSLLASLPLLANLFEFYNRIWLII